ncbi:MAG: hypothetical protein FWG65_01310 [Turicibacter sp.]|nr:hypothetical protein [Turicibacter sp.]
MLKTEFLSNRSYIDKFIEANKEILRYIYVIKIAKDEWFAWAVCEDGRTLEFDIGVLAIRPLDCEVEWSFNPDNGQTVAELRAMKECGFLE